MSIQQHAGFAKLLAFETVATGAGSWLANLNPVTAATVIVTVAGVLASGYWGIVADARRRQKIWEDENRDSLLGQLEKAKNEIIDHQNTSQAKIDELKQTIADQRKSLHELRNETNVRHLQNLELLEHVETLGKQLMDFQERLAGETARTQHLTLQIEAFRLGTAAPVETHTTEFKRTDTVPAKDLGAPQA